MDKIIKKYKVKINGIDSNFDGYGYFPDTEELKPIEDYSSTYQVLDVMTAVAESGVLNRKIWVSQIFANDEVFYCFMEELAEYDKCYRNQDRWYRALFEITDAVNEEGFVLSREIVKCMLEQAEKTGQIEL